MCDGRRGLLLAGLRVLLERLRWRTGRTMKVASLCPGSPWLLRVCGGKCFWDLHSRWQQSPAPEGLGTHSEEPETYRGFIERWSKKE